MVPNSSRIRTYRFPLRNAARATRAVSSGTGPIACGCSDIVFLLLNAFPQFKELHTLSFLHLSKPHRMLSIAFSVRQRYPLLREPLEGLWPEPLYMSVPGR